MHKTHIFDQKNNQKKYILATYLPYFFQTVTGNKQFLFSGLNMSQDNMSSGQVYSYRLVDHTIYTLTWVLNLEVLFQTILETPFCI